MVTVQLKIHCVWLDEYEFEGHWRVRKHSCWVLARREMQLSSGWVMPQLIQLPGDFYELTELNEVKPVLVLENLLGQKEIHCEPQLVYEHYDGVTTFAAVLVKLSKLGWNVLLPELRTHNDFLWQIRNKIRFTPDTPARAN